MVSSYVSINKQSGTAVVSLNYTLSVAPNLLHASLSTLAICVEPLYQSLLLQDLILGAYVTAITYAWADRYTQNFIIDVRMFVG